MPIAWQRMGGRQIGVVVSGVRLGSDVDDCALTFVEVRKAVVEMNGQEAAKIL